MNILLVTPYYSPVLNVDARLFTELASDLTQYSHHVTVLTGVPERYVGGQKLPAYSRWHVVRETKDGIPVHRCPAIPLPKSVPSISGLEHFLQGFQYLIAALFLHRQDIVIVYSPPLPLAVTGILLARRWNGRAIVNIQDLYPLSAVALGFLRNRFLISLAKKMERWVYRHANAVTVHSSGNAQHVVTNGGTRDRVYEVPNWIDLEQNRPGPKENAFRRELSCGDQLIVSFAGNMGVAQGLDDVIGAAALLRKQPVVFLLAGEGAVRPRIERRAQELALNNLRFLPYLSQERYVQLLQASDVSLVTLHKDLKTPAVPGKLPHIMAVGCPVVCSVPSTSDAVRVVEEAGCGLWVEAGQPQALADAILKFLNNSSLRQEMGRQARIYAEQHFRRDLCVQQYEEIIRHLCGEPMQKNTGTVLP